MKRVELATRIKEAVYGRRLIAGVLFLTILSGPLVACSPASIGTGGADTEPHYGETLISPTISESARTRFTWAPAWLPPVAEIYLEDIDREARDFEVSPVMISIIITIESGWNRLAENKISGAQGLGQILPSTAADLCRKIGLDNYDWRNHEHNIRLIAAYLADSEEKLGTNGVLALRESIIAYHDGQNSEISTPSVNALKYLAFAEPMYTDPQNPCNFGNTWHTHALINTGGINLRTAFEQQGMDFDTWAQAFVTACPYSPR